MMKLSKCQIAIIFTEHFFSDFLILGCESCRVVTNSLVILEVNFNKFVSNGLPPFK